MELESVIRVPPDLLSSPVGDEVVLLSVSRGIYYGLNPLGAFLWQQLQGQPRCVEELCRLVCQEYDVDEATCRHDVREFLDELSSAGLVEVVS